MALANLPNETLLEILSFFERFRDLNAYSQVSRHFYSLSNRNLYRALSTDLANEILALAAEEGNEAVARNLLKMCGSKILGVTTKDEPLVIAARKGHVDLVKILLDHCFQHDDTEREGLLFSKALIGAVKENGNAVIQLLLERKANIIFYRQAKYSADPLFFAVLVGRQSTVRLLLESKYCTPNYTARDRPSYLALVATDRVSPQALEIARLLIDAGADLDHDGSPLLNAAITKNIPLVRLLLEKGLDPRTLDQREVVREFACSRFRSHNIVSLLLEWIDVDRAIASDIIQRCFLLRGAIEHCFYDLLERLLDKHDIFNGSHKLELRELRFCPLTIAVVRGRRRAVQLLLNHGAHPNGTFNEDAEVNGTGVVGDLPIELALDRERYKIARMLYHKGAIIPPSRLDRSSPLFNTRMIRVVRLLSQTPFANRMILPP
ncbi:hypothetical protein N7475_004187 [Penicillium sp. IBT 31633x]|nr:hypothetical protein N7475_004187 [Penicillium sp. IBT 31633x]